MNYNVILKNWDLNLLRSNVFHNGVSVYYGTIVVFIIYYGTNIV